MSKLNSDIINDNNENIDYQIQCHIDEKIINAIGVILLTTTVFIVIGIFASNYFWEIFYPLVWFYPLGFFAIYENLKKCKKENIIITLVHKEDAEVDVGEGTAHFYYFYTDTNRRYEGCVRLYNFLQGTETIQVVITRGSRIYGLVKIIDINVDKFKSPPTKDPSIEYTKQGTDLD